MILLFLERRYKFCTSALRSCAKLYILPSKNLLIVSELRETQLLIMKLGVMFLQMTRDEEIAAFIGGALAKETDSFKKRFISMLARLKESDWEVLERMVAGIKKD